MLSEMQHPESVRAVANAILGRKRCKTITEEQPAVDLPLPE